MKVSPAAIRMIKHHEGVRTRPYRCPALLWTVGVGHVIDPSHAAVKYEDLGQYEDMAADTLAEYQYLFEDGKWMYRCTYKGGWNELTAEVCK